MWCVSFRVKLASHNVFKKLPSGHPENCDTLKKETAPCRQMWFKLWVQREKVIRWRREEMTRIWKFPPFCRHCHRSLFLTIYHRSYIIEGCTFSVLNTLYYSCDVDFHQSPQTPSHHMLWAVSMWILKMSALFPPCSNHPQEHFKVTQFLFWIFSLWRWMCC